MKKRLQAAQRILAVQQHMRSVAETKLAQLQRQEAALQQSQHDLLRALGADEALHGLFVESMARRLRALAQQAAHVGEAKELQATQLLSHSGKLKRVERIASSLDREYRGAVEKRELAELIDRLR